MDGTAETGGCEDGRHSDVRHNECVVIMATVQITKFLKAHYSIGIARYTWTMDPGHNSEYCLEEKNI